MQAGGQVGQGRAGRGREVERRHVALGSSLCCLLPRDAIFVIQRELCLYTNSTVDVEPPPPPLPPPACSCSAYTFGNNCKQRCLPPPAVASATEFAGSWGCCSDCQRHSSFIDRHSYRIAAPTTTTTTAAIIPPHLVAAPSTSSRNAFRGVNQCHAAEYTSCLAHTHSARRCGQSEPHAVHAMLLPACAKMAAASAAAAALLLSLLRNVLA